MILHSNVVLVLWRASIIVQTKCIWRITQNFQMNSIEMVPKQCVVRKGLRIVLIRMAWLSTVLIYTPIGHALALMKLSLKKVVVNSILLAERALNWLHVHSKKHIAEQLENSNFLQSGMSLVCIYTGFRMVSPALMSLKLWRVLPISNLVLSRQCENMTCKSPGLNMILHM